MYYDSFIFDWTIDGAGHGACSFLFNLLVAIFLN